MMKEIESDEQEQRLSSYNSYLKIKQVIDIIRKGPCSRRRLADEMGVKPQNTWHIMRVLIAHNVIKICEYEINDGVKQAIYKLVKDE